MRKLTTSLVVAFLLVGVLFVGVNAQQFYTTMDDVIMRSLIVTNTAAFSGAATFGDNATVGKFLVLTQGTTQVLAASGTLTPVTSFQPISSTAAVGTSSIATLGAGTLLRIVNVGAQTVTFTDTGTLYLSGNIALGATDSLLLMSTGTGWVQMGTSDN